MRVLIVGGGGREHALAWSLSRSPQVRALYTTSQNPGILRLAQPAAAGGESVEEIAEWARREAIDFTVVGPEEPLAQGIADAFRTRGLRIFGPGRQAAQIESSKLFAKELMDRHGIPTAEFRAFDAAGPARAHVRQAQFPLVIKADGLAAGKGAIVCRSLEEAEEAIDVIMVERRFGSSGDRIVVEEFLTGQEASVLALVDGEEALPLAPAQDHKAIGEGDTGPNTGGMGAYSPTPAVGPADLARIEKEILRPVAAALAEEGRPYRGVLYAGLMMTEAGPKVVEFNCRFGDPEAQAVLPRLKTDLMEALLAVEEGALNELRLEWDSRSCVCVVLASGGYPGAFQTGLPIEGLEEAEAIENCLVFHGGTRLEGGRLVTGGGRVLSVCGLGDDVRQAVQTAYKGAQLIRFSGRVMRRDIARRALEASA